MLNKNQPKQVIFTYHNNSRQANEGERSECRLMQFEHQWSNTWRWPLWSKHVVYEQIKINVALTVNLLLVKPSCVTTATKIVLLQMSSLLLL
jgi:hypothetical protein